MKIAMTGASGLLGRALRAAFEGTGEQVLRLVRRPAAKPDEVSWAPTEGTVDLARLAGVDAVVHLAGAGVGDRRWSRAYRREIRSSRVEGTATIARAVARLDPPPAVLISQSAIGWYGDTGDREVDESAPHAQGFFPELVADWEAAARPAADAGIRVVHPRTGLVLTPEGGLLARLLPIFRAGLGGRLGSGRQYMSWITIDDFAGAIRFLLAATDLAGPVNLTAPRPVTNREFTAALGRAVHRPAVVPVPRPALRVAVGGFAHEITVGSRVVPARLLERGYDFVHTEIGPALTELAGRGGRAGSR